MLIHLILVSENKENEIVVDKSKYKCCIFNRV